MRHHHHLPYWDDRDLVMVHHDDVSTHEDHHRRYSIPREACEDAECEAALRWDGGAKTKGNIDND